MSLVGALSIRDIAKRTGMTAAKVQRIIARLTATHAGEQPAGEQHG